MAYTNLSNSGECPLDLETTEHLECLAVAAHVERFHGVAMVNKDTLVFGEGSKPLKALKLSSANIISAIYCLSLENARKMFRNTFCGSYLR